LGLPDRQTPPGAGDQLLLSITPFNVRGDPGRLIEHMVATGGIITHHHAVGRDHMPLYRAQRPDLFGKAFAAAKGALDPAGIVNPGVLIP
jgi:alkyldihydroxyacetonephosphate synthase